MKKGLTNAFLQQAATAAGCTKLKALTSCSLTSLLEQNLFSKCIMPTDIRGSNLYDCVKPRKCKRQNPMYGCRKWLDRSRFGPTTFSLMQLTHAHFELQICTIQSNFSYHSSCCETKDMIVLPTGGQHKLSGCIMYMQLGLTLWVLKLLTKFTPRGIIADNYASTACSAAR